MFSVGNVLSNLELLPSTILDAGSEDATFVYWLADRYPSACVVAVDIDASAIAACQAARPASYAIAFDSRSARSPNLIVAPSISSRRSTCWSTSTMTRPQLPQLARTLRPGGTLLVHVPRDQWTTRSGVVHRVSDEEAGGSSGRVRRDTAVTD